MDKPVQSNFYLDAIVTMVDAKHILLHLDPPGVDLPPTEAQQQIAFADRVLLNKIDLVTETEQRALVRRIKEINEPVVVIPCNYGRVDLGLILDVKGFDLARVLEKEPGLVDKKEGERNTHEHGHQHENEHEHGHDDHQEESQAFRVSSFALLPPFCPISFLR